MKFKIGFTAEKEVEKKAPETETKAPEEAPREGIAREGLFPAARL